MAIRTITDLPNIPTAAELSSNLNKSRMEISYLSNDENSIYVSRSVSCGVLSEAIAADILKQGFLTSDSLDLDHLTVKDGLSVNGNFYANVGKDSLDYDAKLNFADISISSNSFKANAGRILELSCGNASVALANSGGKGIVNLSQYAKVRNTTDEDDYVVNVKFLKQKLDELSAKIISDINSGAAHVDVKVDIDFPLLGVIYIDHQIPATNTSWAIAGSTIDLTKYAKLKSYIESSDVNTKLRLTNTGGNDTWSYERNGNKLTLPASSWFFQSIKTNGKQSHDASLSCTFNEAGLPSHSHSYQSAYEATKSSQYHLGTGGGYYFGVSNSCASTGSYSFGKETNTVQPNATKMFVYFYIGQKTDK